MKNSQTSRRGFLKKGGLTAAAIGFPTFIPARALGLDGNTAPSNRIVMGGIGLPPRTLATVNRDFRNQPNDFNTLKIFSL